MRKAIRFGGDSILTCPRCGKHHDPDKYGIDTLRLIVHHAQVCERFKE